MVLGIALSLVLQVPAPDAEQFSRIVRQQHAAIRDLSFLYEGERRYIGPLPEGADAAEARQPRLFQGRFVARADGSTYIDRYKRVQGQASYMRTQSSLMDGRLATHEDVPDRLPIPMSVQEMKGSGGSLNRAGSPHRFLWTWFFREHTDLEALGYRALGVEVVEGHPCLKVHVNLIPGDDANRCEFWIDLERGAHPLRVDSYRLGRLAVRVHGIRLMQFDSADGQRIWLPVHAESDGFDGPDGLEKEPTSKSVYDVINGSVVINAGLSDDDFTIQPVVEPARTPEFRTLQAELDERRERAREEQQSIRTDRAGVEQALDAALAEADAQAKELEASSVARSGTPGLGPLRWGFIGLGLALAVVAVVLVRRGAG